jgi:protease I
LSIYPGEIQARQFDLVPAGTFPVDKLVTGASPDDYDALLLPGGTVNPDQVQINPDAVAFVRAFAETGKPIAAICHGPWTLITAGVVRAAGSPPGPACAMTCATPTRSQPTSRSSSTAS